MLQAMESHCRLQITFKALVVAARAVTSIPFIIHVFFIIINPLKTKSVLSILSLDYTSSSEGSSYKVGLGLTLKENSRTSQMSPNVANSANSYLKNSPTFDHFTGFVHRKAGIYSNRVGQGARNRLRV